MSVSTGVSLHQLEETRNVILEQFQRMKQGDFSDADFETAKIMLKDSVLSTADDMNAMLNFQYQNLLLCYDRKLEDCLNDIEMTTREDVIRLFNQMNHKVTYILKQEEHNEENI